MTLTLGSHIRDLRRQRGLSQLDLAVELYVAQQTIGAVETGVRPQTAVRLIPTLAQVLEADADVLYWLAGRLPPDLAKLNLDPEQIARTMKLLRRLLRRKDALRE